MVPSRPPARRLGACSWSLQPRSIDDLVQKVRACGLDAVQIALGSLHDGRFEPRRMQDELAREGIAIRSGMTSMWAEDYTSLGSIRRTGGVRVDEHWPANLATAKSDAALASALGIGLVTFHAGFLPHDRADPERAKLVGRLRILVDVYADRGVRVGFETGQETAETLLDVLAELDSRTAGVNFDPANMILYGMGEPVLALERLAPHVVQVHVKDARPAIRAGEWGSEVVVGTGAVDWRRFSAVLDAHRPEVDLMIEREAGDNRVLDVATAREYLRGLGAVRA